MTFSVTAGGGFSDYNLRIGPPYPRKKGSVRMASIETANVGRAVAARVGSNIREVRTQLGLTQAQLAAPEFSISYISALERVTMSQSLQPQHCLPLLTSVPIA